MELVLALLRQSNRNYIYPLLHLKQMKNTVKYWTHHSRREFSGGEKKHGMIPKWSILGSRKFLTTLQGEEIRVNVRSCVDSKEPATCWEDRGKSRAKIPHSSPGCFPTN